MRRAQSGVTLIELVIAIVVIATAAATLVGLLAYMSRNSAEGMSRAQSAAIANAYLNEVLRAQFDASEDDIDGYDGRIDVGARSALGTVPDELQSYTVAIDVANFPSPTLSASASS